MNHAEEFSLYVADRAAWAKYVAPRWIELLRSVSDAQFQWMREIAGPELKREIWALADDQLKQRLKGTQ